MSIFFGKKIPIISEQYSITHDIISIGPASFVQKPNAIKLGRALFVPLLLISQLYARKTKDPE